ncbi:MHS family MFS transporter [Micrococcales bacterium 31B]|nr:MHS family MFS transporter [Micrococcales bacterium 31B]
MASSVAPANANTRRRVLSASLIGTSIEFYDYYVYGLAAVLVIPALFFPGEDPVIQQLSSMVTFAVAFIARPVGSVLFGHFGDRYGRKVTLIGSLLTMGIATFLIGCLPGHATIGVWAPIILVILRFAQGVGLGGEWGGAALLATENAPQGKRGFYGAFPQLGAPIGLFLANLVFFTLSIWFGEEAFNSWGWRIPFLVSAALVLFGLYVRLRLEESPVFRAAEAQGKKTKVPVAAVFKRSWKGLIAGTFIMVATYVVFYLITVFALGFAKGKPVESANGHVIGLGMSNATVTGILLIATVFFGAFVMVSGWLADKYGRRKPLMISTCIGIVFALCSPFILGMHNTAGVATFMILGMIVMGLFFGPMATVLPELFPTETRYTGASVAYNLAAVLGASVASIFGGPINATWGLWGIAIYLIINCVASLIALYMTRETANDDLMLVK